MKSKTKIQKTHYKTIAKQCLHLYRKIKAHCADLRELLDSHELKEIDKMIDFDINLLNKAAHDMIKIGKLAKMKVGEDEY